MARRSILLDEIHLHVRAPRGVADSVYGAAHRTLRGGGFLTGLRRAIGEVFRRYPSLRRVRFTLTR